MPRIIFCFFICLLFLAGVSKRHVSKSTTSQPYKSFVLSYTCVGLGSNMFRMQPAFRIRGKEFRLTLEQMWVLPKSKPSRPVLLQLGNVRTSSVDSILQLVNEIKDSVVYRINPYILSGALVEIAIAYEGKKVRFELHNATDSISQKIVTILNSYVTGSSRKLYLSE